MKLKDDISSYAASIYIIFNCQPPKVSRPLTSSMECVRLRSYRDGNKGYFSEVLISPQGLRAVLLQNQQVLEGSLADFWRPLSCPFCECCRLCLKELTHIS